ncbi:MAG: alpha/beta hydrolase [Oligoflexia bacterium]|nr:alpha/beta hydrolase [Oligoflexia bacterium]
MNIIKKTTGFATSFDGTPIFYEVRGEGPPLILCYGIACLTNHWHHQVKYFSSQYQVIMLDYRGHHQSPIPQQHDQLTIDACVNDIKAVVDHLKLEKASFWGHSWGTQLLVRAYDLYPEMFNNIVMINGFASNPITGMFGTNLPVAAFELMKKTYEQLPETSNYLWKKMVYNPISLWFMQVSGGFNPHLTAVKDIEVYLKGVASIDIKVFLTLFEAMMNYDGRSVLDRFDVPTLIIAGEKDTVTPFKYQEALHKRIKGSELTKVAFGSHCTMLDMPEFVNLRIEKFLKENKLGSTKSEK